MAACTFFGHKDTSDKIKITVKNEIINLIQNEEVDVFMLEKKESSII